MLNSKNLENSKWTSAVPRNKEKHFIVTGVNCSKTSSTPQTCRIEAVFSKQNYIVTVSELSDSKSWVQGWQQ